MRNLKLMLHNVLNTIKETNIGSYDKSDKMVIRYKDEYYLMQLSKIDPCIIEKINKESAFNENNGLALFALIDHFCRD